MQWGVWLYSEREGVYTNRKQIYCSQLSLWCWVIRISFMKVIRKVRISDSQYIPYIGNFSRRAILANMTLDRCVNFSLIPNFAISRTVNEDVYCKRGYFRWGKISRKCWQDISRGGNFHDTTRISFIKIYGFYFRVGVIFAKKAKREKREKYPHAKITTFTVIARVYFSLCLFLAISGRSHTQRKLYPREKFPIYDIIYLHVINLSPYSEQDLDDLFFVSI